ncbi:hypothetical protein [Chryseobacterium fistulae]|uniref:DUF1648 domain-containing protein n=1 Tax=Chryseobacterium fistulae TaxID=2675058 RepID=A0A6N4XNM3_9FLAO|nr:hypothetical protein [Chryseobacterium fistulae]CAA7387623.1 hypothetical protein CHRY9393_01773 [Chryseobacterium fistulae]
MMSKKIKLLLYVPFIMILCYSVLLLRRYNSFSKLLAIHEYSNKIDSFGNIILLLLPIVLNLFFVIFVWRLIKSPDKLIANYIVRVENEPKLYYNVQLTLVVLSIFFTVITTILLFAGFV